MKAIPIPALLLVALAPLSAGTIVNVSANTTQQMNTGDTLYFLISNLSLPADVDSVQFLFATLPLDHTARFAAELTSRDGSMAASFHPVADISGTFQGAGYVGPVTVITGDLQLGPKLSQGIFQNTRATLALRNIGPAVSFRLPGYTVAQDMSVTLTSGNYRVGAVTAGALYEAWQPDEEGGRFAPLANAAPVAAPESNSGMLLLAAGVFLCASSALLKRISHRRIQ
jgi:hypothetical protein